MTNIMSNLAANTATQTLSNVATTAAASQIASNAIVPATETLAEKIMASTAAKAGIAVGGIALIGGAGFLTFKMVKKHKAKKAAANATPEAKSSEKPEIDPSLATEEEAVDDVTLTMAEIQLIHNLAAVGDAAGIYNDPAVTTEMVRNLMSDNLKLAKKIGMGDALVKQMELSLKALRAASTSSEQKPPVADDAGSEK